MSDPAAHAPGHDAHGHAVQAPAPDHDHHDEHPHVNYWMVFLALCGLTAVSVVADLMRGESTTGTIILVIAVLTVATCKALFVMMYFMHLKFEGKWKYVLLAPTIILALAIPAALMPDIGSHYYDVQVPQLKAVAEGHGKSHHGGGAHDSPHEDEAPHEPPKSE